MAQLIVRKLSPALVAKLRRRAAGRGRSMEAEHREILREALDPAASTSFKELLAAIPDAGSDREFLPPRRKSRRVRL